MSKKVIVIGAGLGGISAAVSLRAEGFDVAVYEKNSRIGGKLNFQEIDGFGFDLGPSIFTLPQYFQSLWERAGKKMEDYVELQPVTPHWRNFFEDGSSLDLYQEDDLMRAELSKLDGDADEHWRQLTAFLEYARGQYRIAEAGYFDKGIDNLWEMIRGVGLVRLFTKVDHYRRMSQSIAAHIDDPKLRSIFEYFIKYVGSSALDAPGYMNLMPIIQFDYGLWYVKGGMYELANGLGRLLDELGIEIHLNAEVSQIGKNGKSVHSVILGDGQQLQADYVVCNMEVIPAYKRLLDEPPAFLSELIVNPICSEMKHEAGTSWLEPFQLAKKGWRLVEQTFVGWNHFHVAHHVIRLQLLTVAKNHGVN
ncbi:MAG: FAD-dependent oxidoreductase, partial [Verrucomicrobiota bacterium]